MYAVEMEKLNMLSGDEESIWEKYREDIFRNGSPREVPPEDREFVQKMLAIKEEAARDGVTQEDPSHSNVAKDDRGNFKWIDLELIKIS
jgi:hypothetical protein